MAQGGASDRTGCRAARALYIHIPFCASTCPYCDFTSVTVHDHVDAYVDALCAELRHAAADVSALETVYLGGGTPSLLSGEQVGRVLRTVREAYPLVSEYEWTIEANPGTATAAKAAAWAAGGVNRVSVGVQSFDPDVLDTLGRRHSPEGAVRAIGAVRSAGITNVSLDLMYGVPGQTVASLDATLDATLALAPQHVSAYQLTVESDTPFGVAAAAGQFHAPEDDVTLVHRARVEERLTAAGLARYEISNYALPGYASRHNLVYWRHEAYVGCGAAAVGFDGRTRTRNLADVEAYIAAVRATGRGAGTCETLDADTLLFEEIFSGLRLRQGIAAERVMAHHAQEVAQLQAGGFLEQAAGRVRLTERGVPVANEVALRFLR